MQRHTPTNIGRLRKGDRFYFTSDRKKSVHEATGLRNDKVKYNKINAFSKFQWLWDREVNGNKEVVFLRHTILQSGDQCFIQDLNIGDIFCLPGHKETELEVVGKSEKEVKLLNKSNNSIFYTHPLTTGIFIKTSK